MPDAFVPLAIYVRPSTSPAPENEIEPATQSPSPQPVSQDLRDAVREVRRFRAALADSLEAASEEVLRDLAAEVLARELRLAPADVETIARRALERVFDEEPLKLRVHPGDAPTVQPLGVPISPDAALRRGDLILELRYGTIDLTLGARLSAALDALRPR
jgi:flagellar biosynthesis/type III secretory pathway protein FliH